MAQTDVELILQKEGDLQMLQRIPCGLSRSRRVLGVSDVPPQDHAQQAADLSSSAGWFHKVEAAMRRRPAVKRSSQSRAGALRGPSTKRKTKSRTLLARRAIPASASVTRTSSIPRPRARQLMQISSTKIVSPARRVKIAPIMPLSDNLSRSLTATV